MRFEANTPPPMPKRRDTVTERMMSCLMWTTLSQAQNPLTSMPCFNFFGDNEAVIKMIFKGRSPTMRHVSRIHRVALDWLCDRINLDPNIQDKYVDTKNQLADLLTKGNFTCDEWNHRLRLLNFVSFSVFLASMENQLTNPRSCRRGSKKENLEKKN